MNAAVSLNPVNRTDLPSDNSVEVNVVVFLVPLETTKIFSKLSVLTNPSNVNLIVSLFMTSAALKAVLNGHVVAEALIPAEVCGVVTASEFATAVLLFKRCNVVPSAVTDLYSTLAATAFALTFTFEANTAELNFEPIVKSIYCLLLTVTNLAAVTSLNVLPSTVYSKSDAYTVSRVAFLTSTLNVLVSTALTSEFAISAASSAA